MWVSLPPQSQTGRATGLFPDQVICCMMACAQQSHGSWNALVCPGGRIPIPGGLKGRRDASAIFMVHLSHPYMTTIKTIALNRGTFVGKVMYLLFNMLPRLIIVFLWRSKCLLISWLQSPSAVILEPKKMKSVTVSIVSPSIYREVMVQDAMIFVFWMLSFKPVLMSEIMFYKRAPAETTQPFYCVRK